MEEVQIQSEKEILSQSQNPEENTTIQKAKVDWSFLNDIESLISQMEEGKKVRCIVFDTETTGLNHKKDHILELAAVEVENFKLTSRTIHFYIKPRVFVPKNVQEINHIKYDDYKNFWEYYNQDTKSQLEHLLNFIGDDAYLIAHNATFDYYFLMSELKYWGLPEIPKERFRCTLRITKKLFKEKGIETANNKLITLCDYFKILVNPNEGSFHNGLFDTIMTSKLLIHLYKNFANINDYVIPNKYDNKEKKENKINKEEIKEVKERINNMNINTNKKTSEKKIENNNEVKNNEVKNNDKNNSNNHSNNNIPDGNELNLLIKKMNEMIINENSKEKKDEDKKEQ